MGFSGLQGAAPAGGAALAGSGADHAAVAQEGIHLRFAAAEGLEGFQRRAAAADGEDLVPEALAGLGVEHAALGPAASSKASKASADSTSAACSCSSPPRSRRRRCG